MKEKELKIYKMHDMYWTNWGKKTIKICEMYWDVQWIPKKIPKRFRCRFPADHKKYTLNQVNK